MKKSKRYIANLENLDKSKLYTIEEAVSLVKKTSNTKFDATLEVAMNLNLDVKKADQQLRGAVVLPHGTGKSKKILVLAKGDQAKAAKAAGADFVGDVDMLEKIERILNDDKTAAAYAQEIELFKKLKVLTEALPDSEKNTSTTCRMRMMIEYIIAKMSGKPGLLVTAESLIKSGVLGDEYKSQLNTESEEELCNDLIKRVIKGMKKLAAELEDKALANALCVTADGILEQIALVSQKSEIF